MLSNLQLVYLSNWYKIYQLFYMFIKKQPGTPIREFQKKVLVFPNGHNNNPESLNKDYKQDNSHLTKSASEKYTGKMIRNFIVNQGYAYQLLNCEMDLQCNDQITEQLVNKLLELYKNGIQFYNLKKDKRQNYFKKKMDYLTNHPSVLEILHLNQQSQDQFYKKKRLQRLMQINNKEINENVNKILKSVQEIDKKNNEKIQQNLHEQLQVIKKRIQNRKNGSKHAASTVAQNESLQQQIEIVLPLQKLKKKKKNPKAASSFGISLIRQENCDDYFVEKYVDI